MGDHTGHIRDLPDDIYLKFQVEDFFKKIICRKTKLEIVPVLGVKLFSKTIDS